MRNIISLLLLMSLFLLEPLSAFNIESLMPDPDSLEQQYISRDRSKFFGLRTKINNISIRRDASNEEASYYEFRAWEGNNKEGAHNIKIPAPDLYKELGRAQFDNEDNVYHIYYEQGQRKASSSSNSNSYEHLSPANQPAALMTDITFALAGAPFSPPKKKPLSLGLKFNADLVLIGIRICEIQRTADPKVLFEAHYLRLVDLELEEEIQPNVPTTERTMGKTAEDRRNEAMKF